MDSFYIPCYIPPPPNYIAPPITYGTLHYAPIPGSYGPPPVYAPKVPSFVPAPNNFTPKNLTPVSSGPVASLGIPLANLGTHLPIPPTPISVGPVAPLGIKVPSNSWGQFIPGYGHPVLIQTAIGEFSGTLIENDFGNIYVIPSQTYWQR